MIEFPYQPEQFGPQGQENSAASVIPLIVNVNRFSDSRKNNLCFELAYESSTATEAVNRTGDGPTIQPSLLLLSRRCKVNHINFRLAVAVGAKHDFVIGDEDRRMRIAGLVGQLLNLPGRRVVNE